MKSAKITFLSRAVYSAPAKTARARNTPEQINRAILCAL